MGQLTVTARRSGCDLLTVKTDRGHCTQGDDTHHKLLHKLSGRQLPLTSFLAIELLWLYGTNDLPYGALLCLNIQTQLLGANCACYMLMNTIQKWIHMPRKH